MDAKCEKRKWMFTRSLIFILCDTIFIYAVWILILTYVCVSVPFFYVWHFLLLSGISLFFLDQLSSPRLVSVFCFVFNFIMCFRSLLETCPCVPYSIDLASSQWWQIFIHCCSKTYIKKSDSVPLPSFFLLSNARGMFCDHQIIRDVFLRTTIVRVATLGHLSFFFSTYEVWISQSIFPLRMRIHPFW